MITRSLAQRLLLLLLPLLATLFSSSTSAQTINPNQIQGGTFTSAFYKLNNVIYIDGVTYPCTGAGFSSAVTAAASAAGVLDARGCQSMTLGSTLTMPAQAMVILLGQSTVLNGHIIFPMGSDGSALIGQGQVDQAFGGSSTNSITRIKATGATPVISFSGGSGSSNNIQGVRLENIQIDANSTANECVHADSVQNFIFRNLTCLNPTSTMYHILTSNTGTNTGVNHGTLEHIHGYSTVSAQCILLEGNSTATSDVTQVSYRGLHFNFTGNSPCIEFKGADQNWMYDVITFRLSGTGYGIQFDTPASQFGGLNNIIYNYLGPTSGNNVNAQASTTDNQIIGFDLSNSQSLPTIGSGATLMWFPQGNHSGGQPQIVFPNTASNGNVGIRWYNSSGSFSGGIFEDSTNRLRFFSPDNAFYDFFSSSTSAYGQITDNANSFVESAASVSGGLANQDVCYGDSTAHAIKCSYNNGAFAPLALSGPTSTVAGLPACGAALTDQWRVVTDATAPTYNAALTGGGAVRVPVYCNGSAWTSH